MLVNRRTFIVKKPHFDEALELQSELGRLIKELQPDAVVRSYASEFGPFDTIAWEIEHASLAVYEQSFDAFVAHPAAAARFPEWFKRWQEITEPGGNNEMWRLVD